MSHQISLNSWAGADMELAVEKMAKVFRMTLEQSHEIVRGLSQGYPWKFDHPIPDRQAGTAARYLESLGFQVAIQSDEELESGATESMDSASERSSDSGKPVHSFGFVGTGGELFQIFLKNQLLNILTLGIYHFWGKTRLREYLWSNSTFAGDRFAYHGTARELFRGFIKMTGILLLYSGVLAAIEFYGGPSREVLAGAVLFSIYLMIPVLMVGAWRYRLTRTDWRRIRFSFRGSSRDAVNLYFKGTLLTLLTLGLYWPYFKMEKERFWRGNSYFGNVPFEFTGNAKEVFGKYIGAMILTFLTAGIYWIWFRAYMMRYYWSNTRLLDGTFRFTATGGQWFMLMLGNYLLLIFTLGIAYPWVVARNMSFTMDHLFLEGDLDVDRVAQEMQASGALGEEAADAFDIPVDIG